MVAGTVLLHVVGQWSSVENMALFPTIYKWEPSQDLALISRFGGRRKYTQELNTIPASSGGKATTTEFKFCTHIKNKLAANNIRITHI